MLTVKAEVPDSVEKQWDKEGWGQRCYLNADRKQTDLQFFKLICYITLGKLRITHFPATTVEPSGNLQD